MKDGQFILNAKTLATDLCVLCTAQEHLVYKRLPAMNHMR